VRRTQNRSKSAASLKRFVKPLATAGPYFDFAGFFATIENPEASSFQWLMANAAECG